MEKLRIGVLGVSGHLLTRIMLPLSQSKDVEIVALASRGIEKAKAAAQKWNIDKFYGSYEELLADPWIEAVYIPLPNHLHLEWMKKS
ncbi:MAG: Gfo/Idh/MocA family oxidoreductase, partial [Vallitaleaceae bacterium]|nr:Gfo/Idh/MocA family oxidoreductase [Vallitaleaceae bacterium]